MVEEMTEAQRVLAAYAAEAPFALSLVLGKEKPQRELLDLARRANEDSTPAVNEIGSCIDPDLAERFSRGLVSHESEVVLASHVAACPACHQQLDAVLDAGHEVERASVCAAVQRLHERSFANTRGEVHRTWRYLLKWNIVATITETLVTVTLIAGLAAYFFGGTPGVWWLLLATVLPTLTGYLAFVLPRVCRWRDNVLIPNLADEKFITTPSTPRSSLNLTDLTTCWRRFTRSIAVNGIVAYALWGILAAIVAGRWWLLPVALSPGIFSNVQAWSRMRRIRIEWFFVDTLPTQLASDMRSRVWLLVGQFIFGCLLLGLRVDSTLSPALVVAGVVIAIFGGGLLVVMGIWIERESGRLPDQTPS